MSKMFEATPKEVRYLDYDILKLLNERSVEQDRDKNFFFDRLPINKEELYPVTIHYLHNEGVPDDNGLLMRIRIVLNREGDTGWLDITSDEYNLLPLSATPKYMVDAYEAVVKAQTNG